MAKSFSFCGFRRRIALLGLFFLAACQTAPLERHPYALSGLVPATPETSRDILESLQKKNPAIHIQAELAPDPHGTQARIIVRTRQKVHLIDRGFQEFHGDTALYPECEHWFYLTRAFDKKCGDGPVIGSVNALFADGVGLGALFDLFQLARYPFTYTHVDMTDPEKTREIFQELEKEALAARKKALLNKKTNSPETLKKTFRTARIP
ncbi:sugar ABC transporter substrate-binding protein [Leptospirillum ferriphilum]|jgi:hypothetical protein|uniref:Sugar ABC transporter substrate-binding protein n=1 Tax=Leptospirillum ferriphilum (strain ML-04) TaxID=1048260 RepID=J9ZCA7_LEPFM|nr:hypothetical protein [Leptospirillum ferriphilum]AFS54235.1 hypothetical protein LFML04_2039 [Leptospirillum ferriphilum ML-04]